MPTTVTSPDSVTTETCTEFRLKVMIFSPEAGFKFDVTVQKKCFPTKWLIIFNLFKKKAAGTDFDQIVGVEFEAEKKEEEKAVEGISTAGLSVLQARAFRKKVYPSVKAGDDPTKIHNEISKAVLQ